MKRVISIYILMMTASSVWCQTEKIINPSDLKQQTVITEPLSLNKGFLRIGLLYSHLSVDKTFDDKSKRVYLPESTWISNFGINLSVQYGISDRFMVELDIPYTNNLTNIHMSALYPEWDTMLVYNVSNKGNGLGDIVAGAVYQILPSNDRKLSMKAALNLTIPTGRKNFKNVASNDDFETPTGYGVFCLEPIITTRLLFYPYSITAYASGKYSFRGSRMINPADTVETNLRDGIYLTAGASINIHLNEWIALTNDINYYYKFKGKIEGVSEGFYLSRWAVSYEPRIVFQIRRFRLGEAIKIPIVGKNVGADPIYVLMAQYVF